MHDLAFHNVSAVAPAHKLTYPVSLNLGPGILAPANRDVEFEHVATQHPSQRLPLEESEYSSAQLSLPMHVQALSRLGSFARNLNMQI